MKNDRVRCVARWPVRGAVAVVGSGSDSPLNPTLVTRRMEFCMQTAAVFNLLRWQSGCLESCVGIVISPTCIHQNESVPGQERFRFGLLSRTFVKAPNAALKRCPYLHHRHNHEHSPYTAQSTLILSKHDRPCCHTVRLHTRHRRAGCRLSTCRCHIHHYHCHRWRLFGTPCLSFHWRPLHTCCVRLYQVDLLSEWLLRLASSRLSVVHVTPVMTQVNAILRR